MNAPDDDQELLARLRSADPATSLPPAAPERVARLLEDTMSHDLDTRVGTESRVTGTRGRSSLTWSVAAAAVLVIVGGAVVIGMSRDDARTDDPRVVADPPPTVTELSAPTGEPARCLPPNARTIGNASVAVDGTVESVDDGLVTIAATTFYAGEPTDLVTVDAPGQQLETLLTSVAFEPGGRYLVAADDTGAVIVCGMSDRWSEKLAGLYEKAFAG